MKKRFMLLLFSLLMVLMINPSATNAQSWPTYPGNEYGTGYSYDGSFSPMYAINNSDALTDWSNVGSRVRL